MAIPLCKPDIYINRISLYNMGEQGDEHCIDLLTLVLLSPDISSLCSVDPDQLASSEPNDLNLHCLSIRI